MAFDAVVINAMISELKDRVISSKIEKIQQPSKNTLLFSLNNRKETFRFLLSATPGKSRFNITNEKFDYPDVPFNFCMLLRKHLSGAFITDMQQPCGERVLIMDLDNRDAFSDINRTKLILEMMGNGTNIILTDESFRIIDCLRKMSADTGSHRAVQPGLYYDCPVSGKKLNFFSSSESDIACFLTFTEKTAVNDKLFTGLFTGLSPLLAREIIANTEKRGDNDYIRELLRLRQRCLSNSEYEPVLITVNGIDTDFSLFPPVQYEGTATYTSFASLNELVDQFYYHEEVRQLLKSDGKTLLNKVSSAKKRCERKLANQLIELKQTSDKDQLMRKAQLITANIYRLKTGDSCLICPDFYDGNKEVQIELDPALSPQKNAAVLFKKYNKLKNAEIYLQNAIPETKLQLEYLNSVIHEISLVENRKDLEEIRIELISSGLIKNTGKKSRKAAPARPVRIELPSGSVIYYGRNNLQNDEILRSCSEKNDLWFHIKNYHGSHVILHSQSYSHDNAEIEYAASVAALFSEVKGSSKVAVDYTQVKNVKKLPGGFPGRVSYSDYSTVYVTPDISGMTK